VQEPGQRGCCPGFLRLAAEAELGFVDDVIGFDGVVAIVVVVWGDPVVVFVDIGEEVAVDEGVGSTARSMRGRAEGQGSGGAVGEGVEIGNGRIEPGVQA